MYALARSLFEETIRYMPHTFRDRRVSTCSVIQCVRVDGGSTEEGRSRGVDHAPLMYWMKVLKLEGDRRQCRRRGNAAHPSS